MEEVEGRSFVLWNCQSLSSRAELSWKLETDAHSCSVLLPPHGPESACRERSATSDAHSHSHSAQSRRRGQRAPLLRSQQNTGAKKMAQLQKRRLAQNVSFELSDHQAVGRRDKTEDSEDPFAKHAEDSNHYRVQVDSIAVGEECRRTDDEDPDTKPPAPLPNAGSTLSATMRALRTSIQYQDYKEDKVTLPQSAYSLLFTEPATSFSFLFAMTILMVSGTALFFALLDLTLYNARPGNQFGIPGRCGCGLRTAKQFTNFRMSKPATSTADVLFTVRGAQYLSILIARESLLLACRACTLGILTPRARITRIVENFQS